MKHMCKRSESGQTLVFSIVFLAVLMGFAGIVIDGGMFFVERRDMQGDADAAALAAVRELPASTGLASSVAVDYVENQNTDDANSGGVTITNNSTRIQVIAEREVEGAFMGFFGISTPTISASATAEVKQTGALPQMLPFGLMRDDYTLTTPPTNTQIRDDNTSRRGLIYPDVEPDCSRTNGGNDINQMIRTTIEGGLDACAMTLGSQVRTKPGWSLGSVRSGFNTRIDTNTQAITDVFELDPATGRYIIKDPTSPRLGVIPIIENLDGTTAWGDKEARITGYTIVYIGDTSGGPPYPPYRDNGRQVYISPMATILPEDWEVDFTTYDAANPAPVAYTLVD